MKYIEDYVAHFASGQIHLSNFDDKIAQSLGNQCFEDKAFTHKQADIALRLLKRYKGQFIKLGFKEIEYDLENPLYKFTLRVIDQEKSIRIDAKDKRFILKFPFNQQLVTNLRSLNSTSKLTKAEWDADKKHWTLDLNEASLGFIISNLLPLGFAPDEELSEYISKYEEITVNFEKYVPTLTKSDGVYQFKNIKTDFSSTDLMTSLVESSKLGVHIFDDNVDIDLKQLVVQRPLTKVFNYIDNQKFFINKSKYTRQDLISLVKDINLPTAIFLDETVSSSLLKVWVEDMQAVGIDLSEVGVYFRRKNEDDGINFNKYVKEVGLNKEAEDANVKWMFVSSKYPKSLLKNNRSVDICLFENRYVSTHYSVLNVVKNSVFTLQYNEYTTTGDNIVNL